MFRWSTTDKDYSSHSELYAMGWLVKLFRKNATVLPCAFADPMLRGGAVINPDRSVSIALVNRGPAKTVSVDCSSWKTRVDGKQIASTVATSLDLGGAQLAATASDAINCVPPVFSVKSVDKWGNVR